MHRQFNTPIASVNNIRIVHFKRQLHAHYFTEPLGLSRPFESLSVFKTIEHRSDLHLSVLFGSKWSTSLWQLSHLSYWLRLEAKKKSFFVESHPSITYAIYKQTLTGTYADQDLQYILHILEMATLQPNGKSIFECILQNDQFVAHIEGSRKYEGMLNHLRSAG